MDHIGIDVHKKESQIYILAEGGEVIERRIRTEGERFAAVLGARPRARILIEASTDSEWVAPSNGRQTSELIDARLVFRSERRRFAGARCFEGRLRKGDGPPPSSTNVLRSR